MMASSSFSSLESVVPVPLTWVVPKASLATRTGAFPLAQTSASMMSVDRVPGHVEIPLSDEQTIRFEREAYRFAVQNELVEHAITFARLAFAHFPGMSVIRCRLRDDPEFDESYLAFEVVMGEDIAKNVECLRGFDKETVRTIPWELCHYFMLGYVVI